MSNELELLYKIKDVNSFNKYIDDLVNRFNKLDKVNKKKMINNLTRVMYNYQTSYINLLNKKIYNIFSSEEGLRYLISNQILRIESIDNFTSIIEEIKDFSKNFMDKQDTIRITKEQIDDIFNVLFEVYPNLKNVLADITINIFLFDLEDKRFNSTTIPTNTLKQYQICCYYLKNDDDYKYRNVNPIYIFLHEFGHVLSFILTKKYKQVPIDFLKSVNLDHVLTKEHPDAQEVFADFFAISVMHNTKYQQYNVFNGIPDYLYNKINNYFKNTIEKYQ